MRKSFVIIGGVAAILALAQSAPLAFLVFDTHMAAPGKLPDGWRLRVNRGTPEVTVTTEGQEKVLHFRSSAASFGLEREVDVDPSQFRFLTWKWKVTELPRGGDFRHYSTDDQAAQVLVAFSDRRVVSYIWDSSAPQGEVQSASSIPLLHIYAFVCRSGSAELNRWIAESRDVYADYQRVYGKEPSRIKGVRIQINSQHTGTSAESYFGDVAFRATP